MSDLTGKFAAFETQSEANHTELMDALNSIAFALGAPPTTPGTTLADLDTSLSLINANISLQLANDSIFHTALLSAINQINVNTDTLINNSSLNAQRLIAAILQTACACETTAPFIPLPLDVTPTSLVDEAKCRRIQFYLSIFGALINNISNYGGAGAAITSGTIAELIIAAAASGALVGGEVGAIAGPPGAIVVAVVGIIASIAAALGSAYLFTLSSEWSQPPLHDQLVAALYAADSADAGAEAFYNTIGASEVLDTIFKPLINGLWWSGWSNDIYSGVPTVDDSSFDGSICAPAGEVFPPVTGCTVLTAELVHFSDGQTIYCIVWPSGGVVTSPASASGAGADLTCDQPVFGMTSIIGLWASSTPDCHVYWEASGYPNFGVSSTYVQLPGSGGNFYTFLNGSVPFTLTLCVEQP